VARAFVRRGLWLRVVAACVGAAAIVGGALALFAAENGAGGVFLLTLGLVLVLIAWLGPRVELEAFELLGAKIRVREVVARRLQLADAVAAAGPGGPDRDVLRGQAAALQRLDRLHDLYGHIRATQPAGDRRTVAMDQVAAKMQAVAREADFDPPEVSTWFHEGTDALRVVALNVMLARKECRDVLAAIEAIDEPHSLFEQYYGLRLVRAMTPSLDALERQLAADAIKRARRRRRFRRDAPLVALSNATLAALEGGE
jgi:hypothetical protein